MTGYSVVLVEGYTRAQPCPRGEASNLNVHVRRPRLGTDSRTLGALLADQSGYGTSPAGRPKVPVPGGCLESTALLRVVDLRLNEAQDALTAPTSDAVVGEVARSLTETDDLFAALVGRWELDGCAAQRIELVRDDLSSNLVAVAAMLGAQVPVVGVLRRAVIAARSEVAAVLMNGRACGATLPDTCPYA